MFLENKLENHRFVKSAGLMTILFLFCFLKAFYTKYINTLGECGPNPYYSRGRISLKQQSLYKVLSLICLPYYWIFSRFNVSVPYQTVGSFMVLQLIFFLK